MKSERARPKYIACIFTEFGHFLADYCTPTLGTKLDVFGLYFCFDSFKYINFNLKITLPLLLSEQTSVLGKVFDFIFPARVLNKQIAVYKDTSSVEVF